MTFSTFIPFYSCNNPNIRYFVHIDGKKKELKHYTDNIYYFCINRKKQFVKIAGSLYHKKFETI